MHRIVRLAFLVVSVSAISGHHADLHAQQPGLNVTRLYTRPDGLAYFEKVEIADDQRIKLLGGMRVSRSRTSGPDSSELKFHPAPRRQYIFTLSGKCEVTASGGQMMTFDRDHVLLVEDLTGKGHSARFSGPEGWVRMVLEVDAAP